MLKNLILQVKFWHDFGLGEHNISPKLLDFTWPFPLITHHQSFVDLSISFYFEFMDIESCFYSQNLFLDYVWKCSDLIISS